jgi:hypothetical protein
VSFLAGCGGSGGTSCTGPTCGSGGFNNTPAGTYSVLVTATANGLVHDAQITVVVP